MCLTPIIYKIIIIVIAIPGDVRVHEKEVEKIEKYQELKREIKRLWKLQIVLVVVGALGSVTKRPRELQTRFLQKSVLLGTARILRKVLDIWKKEKESPWVPWS